MPDIVDANTGARLDRGVEYTPYKWGNSSGSDNQPHPNPKEAKKEAEANYFAMCLLMPEDFLVKDVKELGGIELEDDAKVKTLAKKYKVSTQLMTLRLGQLSKVLSL